MNNIWWQPSCVSLIMMCRVSECDQFYEWGKETEESGELEAASQYNISHYTSLCKIDGKRWGDGGKPRPEISSATKLLFMQRLRGFPCGYKLTQLESYCNAICGKYLFQNSLMFFSRILVNPDKRPYNISEVSIWNRSKSRAEDLFNKSCRIVVQIGM